MLQGGTRQYTLGVRVPVHVQHYDDSSVISLRIQIRVIVAAQLKAVSPPHSGHHMHHQYLKDRYKKPT